MTIHDQNVAHRHAEPVAVRRAVRGAASTAAVHASWRSTRRKHRGFVVAFLVWSVVIGFLLGSIDGHRGGGSAAREHHGLIRLAPTVPVRRRARWVRLDIRLRLADTPEFEGPC